MIDRRDLLKAGLVTAAGLLLPWEPQVIYSFPSATPRKLHLFEGWFVDEAMILGHRGRRRLV